MARSTASLLPSLLPPLFSLLALIFSALSLSSKDWALQHQYADRTNITTQTTPIYTIYRSPFQICSVVVENVTLPLQTNLTITNPPSATDTPEAELNPDDISTVSDPDSTTDNSQDQKQPDAASYNLTYTQVCQKFKPGGRGKSSCELPVYLNRFSPKDLQLGDRRQCQQIHYAGNFGIASTTFIALGLVCSLAVLATAIIAGGAKKASHTEEHHHNHHNDEGVFESKSAHAEERTAQHHEGKKSKPSSVAPYLNLVLLMSLSIGIACAVVSQFYGILGLIQSASNNGDFIISSGNAEHHDPWVEGRALNTFVTLAWGFAVLAAGSAGAVWRVPRMERL